MFHFIAEGILGFLLEFFLGILWWILLFPVVWLGSLPFILIIALFRPRPYGAAVSGMLVRVHEFWVEWGWYFSM